MRILFPIDGSDSCKTTLYWAKNFLDKEKTEIYLLHVIYFTPDAFVSDYEVQEGINMLEQAKTFFETQGFVVIDAQYILGMPVQAICDYATEKEIDQIIIGSHGRQGLAKFLMGSVSEGVFKTAKQPVLVLNTGPHSSIAISHPELVGGLQID